VWLDHDFHILIERHKETQQALDGKLPELHRAASVRYIGLLDAEEISGLRLYQATLFYDRVDLEHELRLDQVLVGIRHAEILEQVAPSGFVSFLAHGFLSFAIRSASYRRFFTSSISKRRCAAHFRLLLKGMQNVHSLRMPQGVDRAGRIRAKILDRLHDPARRTRHRPCDPRRGSGNARRSLRLDPTQITGIKGGSSVIGRYQYSEVR
jgi:hypothetical protein